jgi:hypothetical protein
LGHRDARPARARRVRAASAGHRRRRRVIVEPTELAGKYATEVYAPLAAQAAPQYDRFAEEQLSTIVDFLRIVNEFYVGQIARVEALGRRKA